MLKKDSCIYEAPLFDMYQYLYVSDSQVGYRYNAVQCNMIQHTALEWLKQNTNQMTNSQLSYPISSPYGIIMGCLLWGFGRKFPALGAYFLAPNAASNTTMVLHENDDTSTRDSWLRSLYTFYIFRVCSNQVQIYILWNFWNAIR